jgi:hypothetical protein
LILLPAPHDRARVRVHPSQDVHALHPSSKGVGPPQSGLPLRRKTNAAATSTETGGCDVEGAIPPAASSRRTEGTLRSFTRISSFAGRVTEAALRRKAKLGAERGELRPAATRMTCSDVHASAARRHKVSGRQLAGAHGASRFAQANVNALPRLAHSRTAQRHVSGNGCGECCVARSPKFRPPIVARMHLHAKMKGLSGGRSSQGRHARYESEFGQSRSDRRYLVVRRSGDRPRDRVRGPESCRVRPDHVMCCIAPAVSERSASSSGAVRASVRSNQEFTRLPLERRRDAKGEGILGRGSSVSFTRCEVSRSWLDGEDVFFTSACSSEERQGCQTWLEHLRLDGKTTPVIRARAGTTEARNDAVKRRPHRSTAVLNGSASRRGNHTDSGCPIDSREWAEVGRTHLCFVDLVCVERRWRGHRRI